MCYCWAWDKGDAIPHDHGKVHQGHNHQHCAPQFDLDTPARGLDLIVNKNTRRRTGIVLPDLSVPVQLAIALGASGGMLLIVAALRISFPDPVGLLFIYLPVIAAAAYFGGAAAGLATTLLSIVSAELLLFAPSFSFGLARKDLIVMPLFSFVALITVLAVIRLRAIELKVGRAEGRLWLLSEASAALGVTFEYETSLTDVAHMMVPAFADWCILELVEDNTVRSVAIIHTDPGKVNTLEELWRSHPGSTEFPDDYAKVIQSGQVELVPEISHSTGEASAQDSWLRSLRQAIGTKTTLRVPIVDNDRVFGAITVGRGDTKLQFDHADHIFAEALGHRCAVAIALGRSYREQREIAGWLQRNLLPQHSPELPGTRVSARYFPAEAGGVGGDWYELIPLPNGQIGLALGDVAGRGIEAAALMGQLRTALVAVALDGHPPSVVMERLNTLLQQLPLRQMVTLVYMVVSPKTMRIRLTNAGHPPPLVVAPDGTTRYLEEGGTVPLGVKIPAAFTDAEVAIAPKSTVVLYSDGLVERRGRSLDDSFALLEQVARRGPVTPEALVNRLVAEMVTGGPVHDDVALLAVQFESGLLPASQPDQHWNPSGGAEE